MDEDSIKHSYPAPLQADQTNPRKGVADLLQNGGRFGLDWWPICFRTPADLGQNMQRELYKDIWASISGDKQMVFLSGPRQTGKTTFVREAAKFFANSPYFNWGMISHKRQLVETPYFFTELARKDS
ncbi:MAG: hypothetical protein WCW52_12480, partial [Elusimicrobiales bacterium]